MAPDTVRVVLESDALTLFFGALIGVGVWEGMAALVTLAEAKVRARSLRKLVELTRGEGLGDAAGTGVQSPPSIVGLDVRERHHF